MSRLTAQAFRTTFGTLRTHCAQQPEDRQLAQLWAELVGVGVHHHLLDAAGNEGLDVDWERDEIELDATEETTLWQIQGRIDPAEAQRRRNNAHVSALGSFIERIRIKHRTLRRAIQEIQPELLVVPAEVIEDIPVNQRTEERFSDLSQQAQTMTDRWEELANEYAALATYLRRQRRETESPES